ncbi:Activator of stress protein 1 [Fusarium oxysporum f. sp. albedinis]|nr:Activator of stress protein 1 [Fusarium oxysporum f. sp. albedinis]
MLMKLLLIPQIYGFFTVILNTVHPPLGCVLFPNPTCSRTDDSLLENQVHELPRVRHLNLDPVWLSSLTELWVSKIKWKGLKQQNGEPTTGSADTDRC